MNSFILLGFWQSIIELSEFYIWPILAGSIVGVLAPLIGSVIVIRRLSFIADTLSHFSLAGITFGVLLAQILSETIFSGFSPVIMGIIFNIQRYCLHDGDGIRTTVFFKGCPLRCVWCHNPEGLSPNAELYELTDGCQHCNLCRVPCNHPDCKDFGRCLHICSKNLLRLVGKEYGVEELAQKLLSQKPFFDAMGGGITLSGGEPLLQADFCVSLLQELKGKLHTTIETSGYASEKDFMRVISLCDFVIMDLKLMDDAEHKKYTGVDNKQILENAKYLKQSGIPHTFRRREGPYRAQGNIY